MIDFIDYIIWNQERGKLTIGNTCCKVQWEINPSQSLMIHNHQAVKGREVMILMCLQGEGKIRVMLLKKLMTWRKLKRVRLICNARLIGLWILFFCNFFTSTPKPFSFTIIFCLELAAFCRT